MGTGRRGGTLRRALVVMEIALALVVVLGAGLMIQSFDRLTSIDPGFEPDRAVTARLSLSAERYPEQGQRSTFYRDLIRRLEGVPEIESSGAVYDLPLTPGGPIRSLVIEGRSREDVGGLIEARYDLVLGDAFEALGMDVRSGRTIAATDTEESLPVAVINETFAERYFAQEDPVGRRFRREGEDQPWRTIVGVVEDVKQEGLRQETAPGYYVPFHQAPVRPPDMSLVVRSRLEPEQAIGAVREQVLRMDPEQPLYDIQPLERLIEEVLGGQRLTVVLLGVFAVLALLLATVGIFGMMAYMVSQRTQEIGLRMALGAIPKQVLRLVVGSGMRLAAWGVGIGLVASFLLARGLEALVFEISTSDLTTYVAVGAFFALVALAATLLPARKATRVDPLEALRHE